MFEAIENENLIDLEETNTDYNLRKAIGFREDGICYIKDTEDSEKLKKEAENIVSKSENKENLLESEIFEKDSLSKHTPPYSILAFEEGFTAVFSEYEEELYLNLIISKNGEYVEELGIIKNVYRKKLTDKSKELNNASLEFQNLSSVLSSPQIYYELIEQQKNDLLQSVKEYENCIYEREEPTIVERVKMELQRSVHNYLSLLYSYKNSYQNAKGLVFLTHQTNTENINEFINLRNIVQHQIAPEVKPICTKDSVTASIDQSVFSNKLHFHTNSQNKEHFGNRNPIPIRELVDETWSWVEESHNKFIKEIKEDFKQNLLENNSL